MTHIIRDALRFTVIPYKAYTYRDEESLTKRNKNHQQHATSDEEEAEEELQLPIINRRPYDYRMEDINMGATITTLASSRRIFNAVAPHTSRVKTCEGIPYAAFFLFFAHCHSFRQFVREVVLIVRTARIAEHKSAGNLANIMRRLPSLTFFAFTTIPQEARRQTNNPVDWLHILPVLFAPNLQKLYMPHEVCGEFSMTFCSVNQDKDVKPDPLTFFLGQKFANNGYNLTSAGKKSDEAEIPKDEVTGHDIVPRNFFDLIPDPPCPPLTAADLQPPLSDLIDPADTEEMQDEAVCAYIEMECGRQLPQWALRKTRRVIHEIHAEGICHSSDVLSLIAFRNLERLSIGYSELRDVPRPLWSYLLAWTGRNLRSVRFATGGRARNDISADVYDLLAQLGDTLEEIEFFECDIIPPRRVTEAMNEDDDGDYADDDARCAAEQEREKQAWMSDARFSRETLAKMRFPRLRSIRLVTSGNTLAGTLVCIARVAPQLEEIVDSGCIFDDRALGHLCEATKSLKKLHLEERWSNYGIFDKEYGIPASIANLGDTLQILRIDNSYTTAKGFHLLCRALKTAPLRELDLGLVSQEVCETNLAALPANLHRLEILSLRATFVPTPGGLFLEQHFNSTTLPLLRKLSIESDVEPHPPDYSLRLMAATPAFTGTDIKTLSRLPALEELVIGRTIYCSANEFAALAGAKSLRRLELHVDFIAAETTTPQAAGAAASPSRGINGTVDGLFKHLCSAPALEALEVHLEFMFFVDLQQGNSCVVNDAAFAHLAGIGSSLRSLKLICSKLDASNETVKRVFESFGPKLTSLHIEQRYHSKDVSLSSYSHTALRRFPCGDETLSLLQQKCPRLAYVTLPAYYSGEPNNAFSIDALHDFRRAMPLCVLEEGTIGVVTYLLSEPEDEEEN